MGRSSLIYITTYREHNMDAREKVFHILKPVSLNYSVSQTIDVDV